MKPIIQDITPHERKMLSQIKWKPGLCLGEVSLRNFEQMTNGYAYAMQVVGASEKHIILPDGLNEFTASYLNQEQSTYNCFGLIMKREPDDAKALNLFFEILDFYLISLGYSPIPIWDEQGGILDIQFVEK